MVKLFFKVAALIVLFILKTAIPTFAQEPKKIEFGGYIKDVQTVFIPSADTLPWFSDNTLENRLRFKYFPTQWLTVNAESRTRFIYGDFIKLIPGYKESFDQYMGFADLSWVWSRNSSHVINTEIDRLNVDFNFGKWQIIAGRQRINWGQNLIWNPNDLVNTYNYFNFEYEERPGTDALNVKYYPTFSSVAEMVFVPHKNSDSLTVAGLYRFNRFGYDIQILAGAFQTDWAIGTGWSGSIGRASFRGEATYLLPRIENGSTEAFIASISGDYTFENNSFIHFGALFNSSGKTRNAGGIGLFSQEQLSPRSLSKGKYNLFGQFSARPTPLLTLGIAVIVNPTDGSAFFSPTATYSVAENFDFSTVLILFAGSKTDEFAGIGQMGYLKFRYSF
jgi:hypothetical protein